MTLPSFILRLWRSLAARTLVLGSLLTLTVMVVDEGGGLKVIERVGYDTRARTFQFWSPRPTDRIIHLDVDEAALNTIGRWPWQRATMADIVDEVRIAGASAMSLDVLFAEEQPIQYVPRRRGTTTSPAAGGAGAADGGGAGPEYVAVHHDDRLAAAIQRFGRVMVPMSFVTEPAGPPPPMRAPAIDVLAADPEQSREEVMARLPGGGLGFTPDEFVFARRDALVRRISAALDAGPIAAEELRPRLLPRMGTRDDASTLAGQFREVYRYVTALRACERFTRAVPSGCPPLVRPPTTNALPLSEFADAAWVSGYVDYFPVDPELDDNVIRVVPLWMNFRGRLYPQMDLAVACAVVGADVRQIEIGPDQIVIPAADGQQIVVPVRVARTSKYGDVGALLDIPWFGTRKWEAMYDYPAHQVFAQHLPAAEVWGLADSRRTIGRNYADALRSAKVLADIGSKPAEAFLAHPVGVDDVEGWTTAFDQALKDIDPLLEPARKDPADKRNADDQAALNAYDTMASAVAEGRKFATKAAAMRARLGGKVVLFGGTATALGDVKATSLQPETPGVVVHGVVTNALLTGHFWRRAPAWVTPLITLVMGLCVTVVVARMTPLPALATCVLLAACYVVVNGVWLFDYGDWIVGLAGPLVAVAVIWGALTLTKYVAESLERARITRRFQRYVDPALVNYLIANPDIVHLEGEVREMSVVFTDLAGYTTLTEKLRERAVKILGRYKTVMVPAIRRHRGFIHSFMGDGIMFSYGAPEKNSNHAIDALNTILDVQEVMKLFNAELATQNLGPLVTRVGVCTGPVVVGDSGSEEGSDYACLGNTTNLAARLESANKAVGTTMMISERTAELLGGRFLLRPIAKLTVKGKTVPEMTFEPLAPADAATDEHRRLVALTTAVFDAYVAARFADCVAAADAMDAAVGPSTLAALYRDTCQEYLAAGGPPADFLGQIVLKEK